MTGGIPAYGLRRRKQLRLHDDIRSTAIRLFAERGFDETSIPDIAAAAEVSPATVFRYFRSKADIVLSAKRAHIEHVPALIAAEPLAAKPLNVARSAVRAWYPALEADEFALTAERLIAATPALAVESSMLRLTLTETLASELTRWCDGPEGERDAAAHAIAAVWPAYAARLRWATEDGVRPATALVDAAFGVIDDAARDVPSPPALAAEAANAAALMNDVRSESRGLRERKAYRLRLDLKRAGLKLFAERGFAATTVDDIVMQADVSRRTFFRYFSSKDDILLDGPFARAERMRELVLARPASEHPLTAARQALWILLTATYGDANPLMMNFGELLILRGEFRPQLMKMSNAWANALAAALAERMHRDARSLAPNVIAMTVLWAAHDGMARWIRNSENGSIGRSIDASFSALQRALTR